MTSKVACSRCGALVLPSTAEKYSGTCAPCANGTREQIEAGKRFQVEERARQEAHRERIAGAKLYSEPEELIRAIDSITDVESEGDLETLEIALRSLSTLPDPALAAPALLGLFERFPWSDAFGGFWSILHALERMSGYEALLVASVRRAPGEFNLLMVNRLLNGGIDSVGETNLLAVLREIAERTEYSERARQAAAEFLESRT